MPNGSGPRKRRRLRLRVNPVFRTFTACVDDTRSSDILVSPAPFKAFETTAPPYDATLACGPTDLLAALNYRVRVFDKAGAPRLPEIDLADWFAAVTPGAQAFDPQVLYDQYADRWVLVASARNRERNEYWFAMSVSETSDPLGRWWIWADGPVKESDGWPDFPRAGITAGTIYLTCNRYTGTTKPKYKRTELSVLDKASFYGGGVPIAYVFDDLLLGNGEQSATVHPCHTYGNPDTQYLVSLDPFVKNTSGKSTLVVLWKVTGPASTPHVERCDLDAPAEYARPEPFASQKQDGGCSGEWKLACYDHRPRNAVFRGGSVWTSFNTSIDALDQGQRRNVVTWLEISAASRGILQQGCYGAPDTSSAFPAIAPDGQGNAALVAVRAASTEYASLYVAYRTSTMPAGELGNASEIIQLGSATHCNPDSLGYNRWADYNAVAIDPADDRIWFHGAVPVSRDTWGSWIASWKAP